MAIYVQSSLPGENSVFTRRFSMLVMFLVFAGASFAQPGICFEAKHVTCNGLNDGSIRVSVNGGDPPYSLDWSNGSTAQELRQLAAGEYRLTVTDHKGAKVKAGITLDEPEPVTAYLAFANDPCTEPANIGVCANGGTPPYTYKWPGGETTEVLNGAAPGMYCVTVTDQNLCGLITCLEVPAPLQLSLMGDIPACGGSQGSATASVSGGTAPYAYQWSNGATTAENTALLPGAYALTVTDAKGCIAEGQLELAGETTDLTVEITVDDLACQGEGSLTAVASGGATPYSYTWNTGQTEAHISGLIGGVYRVTVTDAGGCEAVDSVELAGGSDLEVAAMLILYQCGDPFGLISVLALGGQSPYSFLWSNGQTGDTATELTPGELYTVTVTDAGGCTAAGTFPVLDPTGLPFDLNLLPPSCAGSDDGQATAVPPGDPAGYSYTWSNGSTSQTATGLSAGEYFVTVYDNKGCGGIETFTISDPSPLRLQITAGSASCDSLGGAATAKVSGGLSPYLVNWSNGQSGETITGLPAGAYSATVTDANACEATASVSIVLPPALSCEVLETAAVSGPDASDGAAQVMPAGGTPPFTFSWSNGQTTEIATGLAPGAYSVTVSDAAACTSTCSLVMGADFVCFNITDPGAIAYTAGPLCGPGVDPAPIISLAEPSGGAGEMVYMWMKTTIDGVVSVSSFDSIPDSNTPGYDPGPLPETTYFARCARRAGCTEFLETNIVKIVVSELALAAITPPEVICLGQPAVFSAVDNGAGAVYSWSFDPAADPPASSEREPVVTFSQPGIASAELEVTQNGCTSTTTVSVAVSEDGPGCSAPGLISLYPNPFNRSFFVRLTSGQANQRIRMSLENHYGQKIGSYEWTKPFEPQEITPPELPSGLYILRITTDAGLEKTYRLLKYD